MDGCQINSRFGWCLFLVISLPWGALSLRQGNFLLLLTLGGLYEIVILEIGVSLSSSFDSEDIRQISELDDLLLVLLLLQLDINIFVEGSLSSQVLIVNFCDVKGDWCESSPARLKGSLSLCCFGLGLNSSSKVTSKVLEHVWIFSITMS